MKRVMLALTTGALVLAVAPGVATAKGHKTDERACLKAAAEALHVKRDLLPVFDFILPGTNHDDTWDDLSSNGKADLVCGFDGDDTVVALGPGDLFIGGNGDDLVQCMGHRYDDGTCGFGFPYLETSQADIIFVGGNGDDAVEAMYIRFDEDDNNLSLGIGNFVGGKGRDTVGTMDGGFFVGGNGDDSVGIMYGGLFVGGNGDDAVEEAIYITFDDDNDNLSIGLGNEGNHIVWVLNSGLFVGGKGDDCVGSTSGETTFDGGKGFDWVMDWQSSGLLKSVEDSLSGRACPAP